jgi:hypothetical protein
MATKIFGWTLLIVGLVIIFWTLYSCYNVFTGKEKAPEIFKIESKKTPTQIKTKIPTPEEEMKKLIIEELKEMLPVDVFSKLLNLISQSILAGIFIFGGSQISQIGIKLIKK